MTRDRRDPPLGRRIASHDRDAPVTTVPQDVADRAAGYMGAPVSGKRALDEYIYRLLDEPAARRRSSTGTGTPHASDRNRTFTPGSSPILRQDRLGEAAIGALVQELRGVIGRCAQEQQLAIAVTSIARADSIGMPKS